MRARQDAVGQKRDFRKILLEYRVGHLLADLGWVDLDLESSQAGGPLL